MTRASQTVSYDEPVSRKGTPMTRSESRARNNKLGALIAGSIAVLTIITLIVMITLWASGGATFPVAVVLAVIFGGALATLIVPAIVARPRRGRAKNITGEPLTRAVPIMNSEDNA